MEPLIKLLIEMIGLYKFALGVYIAGSWLLQFNIINKFHILQTYCEI